MGLFIGIERLISFSVGRGYSLLMIKRILAFTIEPNLQSNQCITNS